MEEDVFCSSSAIVFCFLAPILLIKMSVFSFQQHLSTAVGHHLFDPTQAVIHLHLHTHIVTLLTGVCGAFVLLAAYIILGFT